MWVNRDNPKGEDIEIFQVFIHKPKAKIYVAVN